MSRLIFAAVFAASITACSDTSTRSSSHQMSASDCKKIGGKLVEGGCRMEASASEMKAICKKMGKKYLPEYNGCQLN
ncbi:MAG: hypothetical protein AB3N20_03700 [Rhizobiaceae bacterium]